MGKIKIYGEGGTLQDKRLCDTCIHGQVTVDQNSNERIYCHYLEQDLKNKIVKCSEHARRNEPSLRSMEDIAWILVTKKAGRAIGFKPGRELREKYGYIPDKDDDVGLPT